MKIKMRSMMSCKLILLTLSPPSQLRRSWLGRERVKTNVFFLYKTALMFIKMKLS